MIDLITMKQLSEATRISPRTLRRYVQKGTLPHYRIGKLVRFKACEVEHWLNGLQHVPTVEKAHLEYVSQLPKPALNMY